MLVRHHDGLLDNLQDDEDEYLKDLTSEIEDSMMMIDSMLPELDEIEPEGERAYNLLSDESGPNESSLPEDPTTRSESQPAVLSRSHRAR